MSRYGIIVNVDRCAGCFACAVACKEENQVAPGIFWEKIKRNENVRDNVINWFRMSCAALRRSGLHEGLPDEGDPQGPARRSARRPAEVHRLQDVRQCLPVRRSRLQHRRQDQLLRRQAAARRASGPSLTPSAPRARPSTARCACTAPKRGLLPACVEACGIHAMTLVDYDNPTPETAKLIEAARPMNEAAAHIRRSATSQGTWMPRRWR